MIVRKSTQASDLWVHENAPINLTRQSLRHYTLIFLVAIAFFVCPGDGKTEESSPYAFQAGILRTVISGLSGTNVSADQLGNAFNFLGMDEKADKVFPFPESLRRRCGDGTEVSAKLSATQVISKAIKARFPRVIVLNESHHRSLNRAFAQELLPMLRAYGYNTLAVETLSTKQVISKIGPISRNYGYYSNETEFSAFLNLARQLDFKLIAYEVDGSKSPESDRWSWRERTQAENLISASNILVDPTVKLVVYVGYGHVSDAFLPSASDMSRTFMSGWFRYFTNLDPFGVSQTACYSSLTTTEAALGYQAFLDFSAVPIGGIGVDIVVHPGTPIFYRGRGNWRIKHNRSWVRLPATLRRLRAPFVVEARRLEDTSDIVPVDRVVVLNMGEADTMRLALPKGTFSIVAFDKDGSVLTNLQIKN
jgi:hypothetical protein